VEGYGFEYIPVLESILAGQKLGRCGTMHECASEEGGNPLTHTRSLGPGPCQTLLHGAVELLAKVVGQSGDAARQGVEAVPEAQSCCQVRDGTAMRSPTAIHAAIYPAIKGHGEVLEGGLAIPGHL
jgi:hypothetical protein